MPTDPMTNTPEEMSAPAAGGSTPGSASEARRRAAGLGRTAVDKIDEHRGAAARCLERAAATLHRKAVNLPDGGKAANLAHTAADKLCSGANYVREHDVRSAAADAERLVKRNPGPLLAAAGLLGFLMGRTFSRRD